MQIGDQERDGDLDVAVRAPSGETVLFLQASPTSWSRRVLPAAAGAALGYGDLDGGGDLDIAQHGWWLEPPARWLLVTPAMHRVHHSRERVEHDSNYGFNLPWWDRLFGTYRAEAAAGRQMRFGLAELSGEPTDSLPWAIRSLFDEAPAGIDQSEPAAPESVVASAAARAR